MKFLRQFTCDLTGTEVVICADSYGHEVAMDEKDYISDHYCPINVPSVEELEKEVTGFMARNKMSKRVALHQMIENADFSSELSLAYSDDLGADESYNKSLMLVKMLEAEPMPEVPTSTLGDLFPELALLKAVA